MVECPHCGTNNLSADEPCWKCGKSLRPGKAKRQPQRKCAACGKLLDAEVLICPYCEDDRELKLQLSKTSDRPESQTTVRKTDAMQQIEVQTSNAINIRRLTIIAILAVIVTVGTTLVTLINLTFVDDASNRLTLLKLWLAFAVFIMTVGLLVITFNKRLTKPSGPTTLEPE